LLQRILKTLLKQPLRIPLISIYGQLLRQQSPGRCGRKKQELVIHNTSEGRDHENTTMGREIVGDPREKSFFHPTYIIPAGRKASTMSPLKTTPSPSSREPSKLPT
jgi:hypothetical protein